MSFKAIRRATARDIRRICLTEAWSCKQEDRRGWTCSLWRDHLGKHQAWATEPLELCAQWKRVKKLTAGIGGK